MAMDVHYWQSLALSFFCAGCSSGTFEVAQALEDEMADAAVTEDTHEDTHVSASLDTLDAPGALDTAEGGASDTFMPLDTASKPDVPADGWEASTSTDAIPKDATPDAPPDSDSKPLITDAPGCRLKGDDCKADNGAMCCSGVCDGTGWCCGGGRCT